MTREETARAITRVNPRVLMMIEALVAAERDINFYPLEQIELSFSPGQIKLSIKASLGRRTWRSEGPTT